MEKRGSVQSIWLRLSGIELELLPERAVWWPAERALVIADVHLGKDQVFRRSGIAIPEAVFDAELGALDHVLTTRPVEHLVILGDWVHAQPKEGEVWAQRIAEWRRGRPELAITLVPGNHDRRLAPWLELWGIREAEEPFFLGGLRLVHDTDSKAAEAGMSGHLHPVARLRAGFDRVRLPAFAHCDDHLILPAFGRFTGGFDGLDPRRWSMYPIAGGRVFSVSACAP